MASLRFYPFRVSSRPVAVAPPAGRPAPVTGPHRLVTSGSDQPSGQAAGSGAPDRPPDNPVPVQPPGRVAIEVRPGPHATIIVIRGGLDLVSMPVLDAQLKLAVASSPALLVLDMPGTDFMDCGSARLLGAAWSALPAGGQLVIRHPSRSVLRILELTGLDGYCEIEG